MEQLTGIVPTRKRWDSKLMIGHLVQVFATTEWAKEWMTIPPEIEELVTRCLPDKCSLCPPFFWKQQAWQTFRSPTSYQQYQTKFCYNGFMLTVVYQEIKLQTDWQRCLQLRNRRITRRHTKRWNFTFNLSIDLTNKPVTTGWTISMRDSGWYLLPYVETDLHMSKI